MKRLFVMLVAMAIFSVSLLAGNVTKDVKVDSFNKLDVSYCFDVTVEKSAREYLTITIDKDYEQYLVVDVRNGVLHIGIDTERIPNGLLRNNGGKTFVAKVGVSDLTGIEMSGATSFYSDDKFGASRFVAKLSGASKVEKLVVDAVTGYFGVSGSSKLNLRGEIHECTVNTSSASKLNMDVVSRDVELDLSGSSKASVAGKYGELDVDVSGASNCTLEGRVEALKIEGSGASKINGEQMVAKNCEVDLSGASSASVNVERYLEVDLSGASRLTYNRDVERLDVDDISGASSLKKR